MGDELVASIGVGAPAQAIPCAGDRRSERSLALGFRRRLDALLVRFAEDVVAEHVGPFAHLGDEPFGHVVDRGIHAAGRGHVVVGLLYIQDLLTLDSGKRSGTAEKTMSPRVFYIREDQTLDHALAAFLRTHHHLFIVINEFRETVGIVSLEDVIEALLGRKIIDEFDTHEDLRTVAARNPRKNNHPQKREDV